jgi:hypothetical protein
MRRKASDNKYMHKDFHGALSCGIEYLRKYYGKKTAIDYLRSFARIYYAPLRNKIKKGGISSLRKYFKKIYKKEGGVVEFVKEENNLIMIVKKCPAICHIKAKGYVVSPLFCETTRIMNEEICRGTPLEAKLEKNSAIDGRCIQIFSRRKI